MKCGNCLGNHAHVEDVRACYKTREEVPAENFDHQWTNKVQKDAGIATRPMRPMKPSEIRREETRRPKLDTFRKINELGLTVPVGRYALRNQSGAANDIQYIHVQRPTRGPYANKTFLKRQLGPSLERVPVEQQLGILARIAADPQGAMTLYGLTLGICGNCGTELTNEESRKLGIGPVCRKNMGF